MPASVPPPIVVLFILASHSVGSPSWRFFIGGIVGVIVGSIVGVIVGSIAPFFLASHPVGSPLWRLFIGGIVGGIVGGIIGGIGGSIFLFVFGSISLGIVVGIFLSRIGEMGPAPGLSFPALLHAAAHY